MASVEVRCTLLLIVFSICSFTVLSGALDVEIEDDYTRMPLIFEYEDVSECFQTYSDSPYCVVKTVVKPNPEAASWRAIEKYSKKASYNVHSVLDRGLCVGACVQSVEKLDPALAEFFNTERLVTSPYMLLTVPSENDDLSAYQAKYGRILNICANNHLWMRYNLTGFSELERCITATTRHHPLDMYHLLFATIVVSLGALVVAATMLDSGARPSPVWMEFSLRRTWNTLFADRKLESDRGLAFLDTVRVVMVVDFFALHVLMIFAGSPASSMQILEEFADQPWSFIVGSLGRFQVLVYFTIGGILLAVQYLEHASRRPGRRIGWSFFGRAVTRQYLRFLPVLFIMWLFHASWFDRASHGPGDYRLVELEKENCRTNGWLNFLFLNNYLNNSHICMPNTWYLAANFHFVIVGLAVLIMMETYPSLLKPLVGLMICLSVAIPAASLYYYRLPGVAFPSIKASRFMYFLSRTAQQDYLLSHAHIPSYFCGLLAGLAYHRWRTGVHAPQRSRTFHAIRWLAPTMVILQAIPAENLHGPQLDEPSPWHALYGALHRFFWCVMCAVWIVHIATKKRDEPGIPSAPGTFGQRAALILCRLSYCMCMVNFSIVRYLFIDASGRRLEFSWMLFLWILLISLVETLAASIVLALTVQLPLDAVFARLFETMSSSSSLQGQHKKGKQS